MKVWIDISNSPHVLLFRNLLRELEKEHEVLVTARKFAYIEDLLEQEGIDAKIVGKHGGKALDSKLEASLDREVEAPAACKEGEAGYSCKQVFGRGQQGRLRPWHKEHFCLQTMNTHTP